MAKKSLVRRILSAVFPNNSSINKFNEAFIHGGGYTTYDTDLQNYIEKGYNVNPLVYSIVDQMSTKTASVPFYVKEIEDKQAKNNLSKLMMSTKGDMQMTQFLKYVKLQTKAFSKEDKPFPLERPNPNQTWAEFVTLYKTFIKCTGNVYLYMRSPQDGMNKGTPQQIYLLPSHLIQIITKDNVNLLEDEDVVKGYMLIYGNKQMTFESENVVHIKYSNPNFDENGAHLYGLSPLQAALRNIQSSNTGLDLNIKTMLSGGAFGFIHAKNQTLTDTQAKSIKDRLLEMNASTEALGKIGGFSAELAFTRMSLTSDELKPFDYFNFDEKQISDCLNWATIDGNRGDFGGTIKEIRKQRVVDNIQPDLKLLQDALNLYFIPKFKGYDNCEIIFDVMELPEMQSDVKEITEWLNNALDRGVVNRNEYRNAIQYLEVDSEIMEVYTVTSDVISLEEAIENDFAVNNGTT